MSGQDRYFMALPGEGLRFWPSVGGSCEVEGPLEPGVRGFHVIDGAHVVEWLAPALWEVEPIGDRLELGQGELMCRKTRVMSPLRGWSVAVGAVLMVRSLARALRVAGLRHPPGQTQAMLLWFGQGVAVDTRRYPQRDVPICAWGWAGPLPITPHPAWIVNNTLRAACAAVGDAGGVPAMQDERQAQTEDLWELLGA